MYDCCEGAAYGQTNRPNPVIIEKSDAYLWPVIFVLISAFTALDPMGDSQ